jgi:transcriptional regulator GlxA family with amidase domain
VEHSRVDRRIEHSRVDRLIEHSRVAIVVFDGCQALDATGPHEVFAGADTWLRGHRPTAPRYHPELVAVETGPVRTESGLHLIATRALADLPSAAPDTLVVVGGDGIDTARADDRLLDALRAVAPAGHRVASVCTGTYLLAAAGLVTDHRVTTHWARAGRLAGDYPHLRVDPDAVYVRDRDVWTSAGVTAGIDLALAMVEDDHGAEAAQTTARWLVMFLRRPGGQSQFAAPVWQEPVTHPPIRAAHEHILAEPGTDLSVDALAARVGMSPRHFQRVFTRVTGCPPARYVEQVRVDTARRLLERGASTLAAARAAGFGTTETMRRAFVRRLGVPPSAYRTHFAIAPASPGPSPSTPPGATTS